MGTTTAVLIAAIAFVGSHFLLSHPLRRPFVRSIGEAAFLGLYSLVAIATLAWMVIAYRAAAATLPLWPVGNALWAVVTFVMLIASVLLMGSLVRNPALPNPSRNGEVPEAARGVYAITRHPMLWSFVLWGLCHIAIYPVAANIIVAGAIVMLALIGAAFQDRKKEQLLPDLWPAWEAKTSFWPFAAVVRGEARLSGFGMHDHWAALSSGLRQLGRIFH